MKKPSTIERQRFIAWYDDLCERYNIERVNIEALDDDGVQSVYERTCLALGLPSLVQPNKLALSPKQMEAYFYQYVKEMSYKTVTVSFTNYGEENTIMKPVLLSVAGFKIYLMEKTGVQPYTTTSLLSNRDFKNIRALIYEYIEQWAWMNSGKSLGEIDGHVTKMMLEHRINPFVFEHNERIKDNDDEKNITPDDYRNAVMSALNNIGGGDNDATRTS